VAQDVFVDLTSKKFVATLKGGQTSQPFGEVFHQDKLYLRIQPLDYDSGGVAISTPYEVLDASGYSISLLVTDQASTPATLSGPATSWSPDGSALVGSIDLNTAAMNTAFTSASSVATYFWLQITDGTNRKVTIKTAVTIYKSAITSGTPTEYPLDTYLTAAESVALFVKWSGNPAGKKIALSKDGGADGADDLILGENSDQSFGADAG
jgi:hypothetical protein